MSYGPRTFYVLKGDQGQLLTTDTGATAIFHDRPAADSAAQEAGQPWTVKPLTY